jgi:hypothetical protein
MNVQYEAMVEKYGASEAARRCDEIEALGGFGDGRARNIGGLDLIGILAESNNAIPDKDKARIAELADVSRKEVENKIERGRKAVANGERGKEIIPPDHIAEGTFRDGSTIKERITR